MKYVQILKSPFASGLTTMIYMKPGSKVKKRINPVFHDVSNLVHDLLLVFYSCLTLNNYASLFIHYLVHDRFFQGISVAIYIH